MTQLAKPPDPIRELELLRLALTHEAYSGRLSLQVADRKKRIITMIDMKLAGRLGPHEALPDGRS